MRIHTSIAEATDIFVALGSQINLGRIASHVSFKILERHGSRSHHHGWEIQLEAFERDNGRRAGNSGSYGALRPEHDGYAATFDEWGWLIAALYKLDADMVVGTPKYPVYRDAAHFHEQTAWTYDPERWLEFVNEWPTFADERDPFPFVTGQPSRTKRGYMIGRRGASRVRTQPKHWPGKHQPRTVEEVRAFAYPMESNPVMVWFRSATDGSPIAAKYAVEHWTATVGYAMDFLITATPSEEKQARLALMALAATEKVTA